MKKILIALVLLLQFSCAKSICEDELHEVVSARSAYNTLQTEATCIAYRDQIENYLKDPCTLNEQVDYEIIFGNELNKLPCYKYNTIDELCVRSLKKILRTGERYNNSNTTEDCIAYKSALEAYISEACLNSNEYQSTLQNLSCF